MVFPVHFTNQPVFQPAFEHWLALVCAGRSSVAERSGQNSKAARFFDPVSPLLTNTHSGDLRPRSQDLLGGGCTPRSHDCLTVPGPCLDERPDEVLVDDDSMGGRCPLGEERNEPQQQRVGRQLVEFRIRADGQEQGAGPGRRLGIRGPVPTDPPGRSEHPLDELEPLIGVIGADVDVPEARDSGSVPVGARSDDEAALGIPRDE